MSGNQEFTDLFSPLLDNLLGQIDKDKFEVVFYHQRPLLGYQSLFNRKFDDRAFFDCVEKITYFFLDVLLVSLQADLKKENLIACAAGLH